MCFCGLLCGLFSAVCVVWFLQFVWFCVVFIDNSCCSFESPQNYKCGSNRKDQNCAKHNLGFVTGKAEADLLARTCQTETATQPSS